MSRIGKKPVALPKGVTASVDGQTVKVKGPKGELSVKLVPEVAASVGDDGITVTPRQGHGARRRRCGACRARLVNNLVVGVTTGFTQKLEIQGVGYRAAVQGKNLNLQLGFSHDVRLSDPGRHHHHHRKADHDHGVRHRQAAGRPGRRRNPRLSPPEPYKGKGVRYEGEYVRRKEGKKK